MRKKILPLGMLITGLCLNAQTMFVGNGASVNVKPETLVYSGGTVNVTTDGVVTNEGNFKIVDGNFTTGKTDGANFIIKQNSATGADVYGNYGQLWIDNNTQSNITGTVKKEFQTVNNGKYQQLALPFEGKPFSELSSELGKSFSTERWSENEILVYNNTMVRSDHIKDLSNTTNTTQSSSGDYKSSYYMLGAKGSDFTTLHTVKGTPFYSANHTVQLSGAPASMVNFGTDGNGKNAYGETYKSYMYDAFYTYPTVWTGTYGKNIYQFGNPFLTNLDLTKIPSDLQNKIQGIRVEVSGVDYDRTKGSSYIGYKYVTFSAATGTPVGDVNLAIVKPMGTFVIKMKDAQTGSLDLATLRTFNNVASIPSGYGQGNGTMSLSKNNLKSGFSEQQHGGFKSLSSDPFNTVKQLGIIALDENDKELGRTYYMVSSDAQTGTSFNALTQVKATGSDVIGTYEEKSDGGYDEQAANSYWLYINEANENDFKGKDILLALYGDKIKNIKFEIRENAKLIKQGQDRLSNNESFYISSGEGNLVALQQDAKYPVTQQYYNLYYGRPENSTLKLSDDISKPSDCLLVYDSNISAYRLIFDSKWNEANIKVYDMAGRVIISKSNYKTDSDFIINLPEAQSTYVVTAVSKDGQKFSQKILK
ncbi:T9SS type A sorting domain-containing protein [Riemerella columbina]|uniref:T9SS type A sorting domain-containing protein n=1 Tax=Riemerella columbina TaxID=103810 RepID=UPI000372635D|nr:T9SS type A sorting domain-containing protein [Riemerella columbina]